MAALENIRVKLGVLITVLIAVALLSFIIDPSTLEMTVRSLSSKYDVGEINGKSIRYEDYQSKVEYYKNIYSMTSGSQAVSEKAMDAIYETAWQDFESEYLIIPEIKKAGLNVGEEEILDLSQGKELSPIIAQEPAFRDENGAFSRTKFIQFIQAIPSDQSGNLASYWSFLEKNIVNQQYFSKYNSLLTASNYLNSIELRRGIEDNNITNAVDFVIVPFGFQQDSTITVTSSEIEHYYKAHKNQFKQKASRDVEFVVYEVVPSEKDFEDSEKAIEKVYGEFTKTNNLKTFLSHNSDTPLSPAYYKKGELESEYPELEKFAFQEKNPTVLAPFKKGEMYIAARINDTKMMSDSAFVQHILLAATDTQKADSLMKVIAKGGNFSNLAAEYSLDKNKQVENPGDIGWMTQTMMIPGMESVLTQTPGSCVKINTQYGIHLVKVTKRTPLVQKVQLALLTKDVIASKETFQTYYSKANDLSSRCEGKIENFNKITQEDKLAVVPAMNIIEGAKKISKYENTREVTRWIYEAKHGEVSPIITVDNKYFFVVAVTAVREDGYAPIKSVAFDIKNILNYEKKGEKLLSEVKEKISGLSTMEEIAEKLNTTVTSKNDIAFGSMGSQSFDPILIGAISGAKEGVLSGPVKGNVGVYVFKVNGRETGSFYTENDAKMRSMQLANYQINSLPSILEVIGDVQDHRGRFF